MRVLDEAAEPTSITAQDVVHIECCLTSERRALHIVHRGERVSIMFPPGEAVPLDSSTALHLHEILGRHTDLDRVHGSQDDGHVIGNNPYARVIGCVDGIGRPRAITVTVGVATTHSHVVLVGPPGGVAILPSQHIPPLRAALLHASAAALEMHR